MLKDVTYNFVTPIYISSPNVEVATMIDVFRYNDTDFSCGRTKQYPCEAEPPQVGESSVGCIVCITFGYVKRDTEKLI